MKKQLVIVESPAKAKTIERFLGNDYNVLSSFGHIRDLPKKGLSVDIEHDFKPTYEISPDKTKVVASLKKAAKSADKVWLASDEDREGEAIAWHLCSALDIPPSQAKRIVFHEITKTAIDNAIKNPRSIDIKLVDAQQARRILDRLVGYELSPILWKKVRPGLSAGRVQSVAVRLVVEREREINKFKPEDNFKVTGEFHAKNGILSAELDKRFTQAKQAEEFLKDCIKSDFTVLKIDEKPSRRSPSAPFTTSTLQQEAARKLGYSVKQTMTLAQRLYEEGHITYMRTDSTLIAEEALKAAGDYIKTSFGDKYYSRRQFQTKQASAQEAHEAIRPTHFKKESASSDEGQNKLYKLIWRRTLASQMSDAQLARTEVSITISKRKEIFLAKGEVVTFDGFLKVYGRSKEDSILPKTAVGEKLDPKAIEARQTFSKPPARYSEASLVRKLEDLGIGRPSTYAPTISTIQSRGYIEKTDIEGNQRDVSLISLEKGSIKSKTEAENYGNDKSKLLPTPMADVTTDFLTKYFSSIVDFDFTAKVEKDFDLIAEGREEWVKMLANFWRDFKPLIKKSESVSRAESTQAKKLGTDPVSKKPIFARYGRYGPMLQKGETTDEEKPDFASLPEGATLEDVTLEQALEMFKLPRVVGKTEEGSEIVANIGRFGPYIQIDKVFVSIKDQDPFKITEKEAIKLYKEKQTQTKNKYIKEFEGGLKVANGPYGPYITNGKRNVKVPDELKPDKITEKEAKDLLKQAPERKGSFRRRKKAKTVKT
ncbi:MAG TPA: type I DNA topoisomerase [Candidatus Saccharimonadales bacterium]|nr:type I DNA topoisomerase [Candidatus Saccharimonadales bacterium]